MDVNVKDFKELYVKTAEEYLGFLRDHLLDNAKLEELHRSAHSLKGQSLAMGYSSTGHLALVLEKYYRHVIDEAHVIDESKSEFLRACVSQLANAVESIRTSDKEPDMKALIDEAVVKLGIQITV